MVQENIKEVKTFSDLQDFCLAVCGIMQSLPVCHVSPTFEDGPFVVDEGSLALPFHVPSPHGSEYQLKPVEVPTNGDCLPHAVCAFAENITPHEVRVRITVWAVENEEKMLDHEYLARGIGEAAKHNLPLQYAMYSEFYDPSSSTKLNDEEVRELYRQEVMANRADHQYMGIWQIHAIAESLKRPVMSVYPSDRGLTVRPHLHRLVLPEQPCESVPMTILWTSTRNQDWSLKNWRPNHFVPLLPSASRPVLENVIPTEELYSMPEVQVYDADGDLM
jgi:hypothetical protein